MPENISELVLVVDDVAVCAQFYEDAIGLTRDSSWPGARSDTDWAWFWTGAVGDSARLALRNGPLMFEEHSPLPAGRRFGAVHFALEIKRGDLEGAVERLRSRGVEVLMGEDGAPVRLEWMGAVAVYCFDPAGNLVELWATESER